MEKIRLQKFFTDCKIMSRRSAEAEIAAGKVTVNGKTASVGDKADPQCDVVAYMGKIIEYPTSEHIYVMLNKPRGYLTSMTDDRGRKCVSELVDEVGSRIYPIGRLDLNSEGLLLLTDDGELANIMTHPRHKVNKIYRVSVRGNVDENVLTVLSSPLVIDGYKTSGALVSLVEKHDGGAKLEITLREGRNRQIRKMCEQAGLKVSRLCRVQIGEIKLGALSSGKWKYLDRSQVRYLQKLKDTNI